MSTHYKINPRLEITITTKTTTVFLAALAAIALLPIMGIDEAFAFEYSHPEELSEEETAKITSLAKQAQYIQELKDELAREDATTNKEIIAILDQKIATISEYANPLGFYTHEQYAKESLDKRTTPTEVELSTIPGITNVCGCNEEISFRAGFQYKLWGFTADTHGVWKTVYTLNTPLTSTAYVGSFVPDWVKPYAQAFQHDVASGDIEYTLELQNSSGGSIVDYGNHIKGITSSSIWFPNQWNESQYNNPSANDKVVMVGNADSWH